MSATNTRSPMDMNTSSIVPNVLLMTSSYLNVALYALEIILCCRYFRRPNRPLLYKCGVAALIFFDTACTIMICVNVIFVVLDIPLGGPVASLAPTSVVIFMTYSSAAVEQAVLCHLFHSLTKNMIISAVLASLILVHMGVAFASGGLILALNSEVGAALKTASVASITCAATDILIASCLGFKIWKMLSPKDVTPSESIVRKFFLLVISSGLIVAANTLIMMGLLIKHNPAFDFFFSCQGRVYSLTLLANFLVGVHFRKKSTTDPASTRSRRGPSAITDVNFDIIDGYDTESGSQHMRRSGVNINVAEESKPPTPSHHPIPFPTNAGVQSLRLQHGRSLRMKSEP